MEPSAHRQKVSTLAEDLDWLESHCRKNPELNVHAAHLRLAGALTRNVIGPSVNGQAAKPLYIAVVGGAGAGKSTVVNFLCGTVVAEANPQAGYTRHPTAFVPALGAGAWPSHLGFLGSLQRLADDKPADVDEDVYQVKKIPTGAAGDPISEFVVWDCPDMTTWASANYVTRLMEVVALADVVVYVASDERYNDEVPTQFLHLVLQAGKAVVCCLTKMSEVNAEAFVAHFRQEILSKWPEAKDLPVVVIPNLPGEVRKDPGGQGSKYRAGLWNPILALAPSVEEARKRTLSNAVKYLEAAGSGLLDVARRDLSELENWRGIVTAGRSDFEMRYRTEYLAGEAFAKFDRTREQVMRMLELPGPGQFVSAALALVRKPYDYARSFIRKSVTRPAPPNLSERAVCTAAMEAWLDQLRAEALRRAPSHPVWKQITHGFDGGLRTQALDLFGERFRALESQEIAELDEKANALPSKLVQQPLMLNIARAGIIALDLIAIGLIIWLAIALKSAWWLLLILLAISITRHAVEFTVRMVVDSGRNKLKKERQTLFEAQLSAPVQTWLGDWPTTGGSAIERLQLVLRRVPDTICELGALTANRTAPAAVTPP